MGTQQDSMSIAPFEWVVTQEEIDDLYVRIDKVRYGSGGAGASTSSLSSNVLASDLFTKL